MGGRIGVDSEPGNGSTFWFELSLPKLIEAVPLGHEPLIPANTRALVVDDNKTNRRVLTGQLTQMGVEAEAVGTADEALKLLQDRAKADRAYDVVILDRFMPGTDGIMLAQKIRADEKLRSMALVIATSASHLSDLEEFKRIGLDAFLFKPARLRQLRQCIARVLASRALGDAVRQVVTPFASDLPSTRRGGLRVLIVEDNFVNQKVAQRHMEKLGHHADVADNGAQALDVLALQRYDVIFMDCQMPVLDGYETTRRIRSGRVPNLDPTVPIIALTAYATESDRQKCFAAGMDDFVAKPIRFEDLQAALDRRVVKSGAAQFIRSNSATPFENGAPVLDRAQFDHLCDLQDDDDPEFIRDLVDLFLAETPRRLLEIARACKAGDARTMMQLAHTVKGASANFGARALQAKCQQIELFARAGKLAEADELISGLDDEFKRLADVLNKQKQRVSVENPRR
jgi:CheY-like chemotaxis protein/HPt (histidine-containing phosphotransfer) domain-containing protein